jgi:hypothetical protein
MSELDELYAINQVSDFALSYSRLSDFDRNGAKALNKQRSELTGLGVRIGSLVDDLLLNKDNFDDIYYIFDGSKPTATLGKLCDIITKNYKQPPNKKSLLKLANKNGFWLKWSNEKVMEAIDTPDFWGYLKSFYASRNKTLVTTADIEKAESLVNILRTHEYSSPVINSKLEHHNQFKFNIKYQGFVLRGIIDKVLIDHENQTVRMIDLKTGQGTADEFVSSFIKWRYYLQAAIYVLSFTTLCETLGLVGYTLLPFQFLYIGRSERLPLLFTFTNTWHKAAINGFTTNSGWKYRGLNELLAEVHWHLDNKVFDTTRKVHEAKGSVLLDDSFISLY